MNEGILSYILRTLNPLYICTFILNIHVCAYTNIVGALGNPKICYKGLSKVYKINENFKYI